MGTLRVVLTDLADPAYCTAVDQAVLEARGTGSVPDTLHLYRRSVPTVSLGYFQRAEESVDLELAREKGVSIVKRVSGGSAIFTDPSQWIYAVVLGGNEVPEAPAESYPIICQGVIEALASLGITSQWRSLNDVTVRGRKISGSAQTRKHGAVLQHGTLLVSTDLDLMIRLLLQRKDKTRGVTDMTTVERELGRHVDMGDVRDAMVSGFAKALHRTPAYAPLTHEEMKRTGEIVSGR